MPDALADQTANRFQKAAAFLTKAQSAARDDLISHTVLTNAIESIKNTLHGYLLYQITRLGAHRSPKRWLEVSDSNASMSDLLGVCAAAGLDLHGNSGKITSLNDIRNARMHDDPGSQIQWRYAKEALDLAENVTKWAEEAIAGGQPAAATSPAAGTPTTPAAARGQPTPPTSTAAPTETPTSPPTRQSRIRRVLVGILAVVVALVVGAAAGIGLLLPAAASHAPDLAAPVIGLLPTATPAVPSPTATPQPTPTLTVSPVQTLGALTIQQPVCGVGGVAVVQITNSGADTLAWSAASLDAPNATIALSQGEAGAPAQFGQLVHGASGSLYLANPGATAPYTVVVVSEAGAARVVVPVC